VEFSRKNDILLCHDAAYTQVMFDSSAHPSVLQVPGAQEVAIEFSSLSKSHNMAGWRVGAVLGNKEALQSLYTLKTNADSGHFRPILDAAVVAMTGDQAWIAKRNEVYRQRKDVIVRSLQRMGLQVQSPAGSLYVWSPIPVGWKSDAFVAAVLENAQVSFTPGTLFGKSGEGYMRIAITVPQERIQQAMDRLESWLNTGRTI
jgi:LL-diaminopimelate aminotransferase